MPGPYQGETTSEVVKTLASLIHGKVVFITGASPGGLGAIFAENTAVTHPTLIILAGRSSVKVEATTETALEKNPKALYLNLGSFQGAREAAPTVNGWSDVPHVDVPLNNAGGLAHAYEKSQDGRYETYFLVNHQTPWLFSNLIIGRILASKDARIVNVASDAHQFDFTT